VKPGSIDPAGRQNYDITGGSRPNDGPNLFHSFGDFSVGTNNVARFLNDSGRSTTNILSRVTGGNPSAIFGEINTRSFGSANLFLINPAGVVFGPNATLNVGGSAHYSTAGYLRLSDGAQFFASLSKQSTLSSAPVTAFGFLGEHAANPITVQAGNPSLSVNNGQTISLIGGDISIVGRTISASGGQINVASVADAGDVLLNTSGLEVVPIAQSRSAPGSMVTEGTIFIKGGALVGTVNLGNNAVLKADAVSGGKAGHINIEAKTLNAGPGTFISAGSGNPVNDGNVLLTASNQVALSSVALISGSTGSGDTANVTITTPGSVSLTDGAILQTSSSTGNAGSVFIRSKAFVMNNAGIEAKTTFLPTYTEEEFYEPFASYKGGNVDIRASTVHITGGALDGKRLSRIIKGKLASRIRRETLRSAPQT
jgi:filamentous hemagglutinin family protein